MIHERVLSLVEFRNHFCCELLCGVQVLTVRTPFMECSKLSPEINVSAFNINAAALQFLLNLLKSSLRQCGGRENDDLADVVLVQGLNVFLHFGADAISVNGGSQEQNVHLIVNGRRDLFQLTADRFSNLICQLFCISGFGKVAHSHCKLQE